jgi:glyoxylase-like metal-dependent hydrolase (beta-lactamase superfamily II)
MRTPRLTPVAPFAASSRRAVLAGGLALATAGGLPGFSFAQTGADRAARWQRLPVGDLEVTVLSDGRLRQPTRAFGTDVPEAEREALFRAAGVTDGFIDAEINVTAVKRGDELVLIDVGGGPNLVESAGQLGKALEAAGIDPGAVTRVVLTHGHPDHLWGAIDEFDDSIRFPNARWAMSKAEWDLWMTGDPTAKLPAERHNLIPGAVRNLKGLGDRVERVEPGQPLAPDLASIEAGGHTQGHMGIVLGSGPDRLLVLGDALVHAVQSFAHPEWRLAADHEHERAVATRRRLLDMLAGERVRMLGYHLPFPGIGRVERRGKGYAFVAGV